MQPVAPALTGKEGHHIHDLTYKVYAKTARSYIGQRPGFYLYRIDAGGIVFQVDNETSDLQ